MKTPASHVLGHAAAAPAAARRRFAAKLALETDPSDVHADLEAGVKGFTVLDTRSPAAYAAGHVPGAVNLWHREMTKETVKRLSKKDVIIVYCAGSGCNASTKGAAKLAALGFRVKEMIGGLEWWKLEGYPVATGA